MQSTAACDVASGLPVRSRHGAHGARYARCAQAEARHASQLSALDAQYQNKIMAEVERYQQLLQEKAALNERCGRALWTRMHQMQALHLLPAAESHCCSLHDAR